MQYRDWFVIRWLLMVCSLHMKMPKALFSQTRLYLGAPLLQRQIWCQQDDASRQSRELRGIGPGCQERKEKMNCLWQQNHRWSFPRLTATGVAGLAFLMTNSINLTLFQLVLLLSWENVVWHVFDLFQCCWQKETLFWHFLKSFSFELKFYIF